jgi:cysteine desulfurase
MLAALDDGWADPGKLYSASRRAGQLLDAAKETTADLLGVRRDELAFTGSGTRAVQGAVLGGLAGRVRAGRVLVHSAIEHSAVLHCAEAHVRSGGSAVTVGVDSLGSLDRSAWQEAVTAPGVALACLIHASHEVGTLQPVEWAHELCRGHGVPLFVDAAITAGRLPVPSHDFLSVSARKWGGPAGVGVLVTRKGTRWLSPWPAGEPPLNLPAVIAAAASLHAVTQEAEATNARLSVLVDRIRQTVSRSVPDVEVVGDPVNRAPHLVTFSCLYADGEALLHALDKRGFAVSSGSSCTSSTLEPSHVLVAMKALTHGNIRISLHHGTTDQEVDRFLAELPVIIGRLRAEVGM